MTNWTIRARAGDSDLRVEPAFAPLLPDGTDAYAAVAAGHSIGEVPRFEATGKNRRAGDMLWTTCYIKIASRALVTALADASVPGWRTFDVEVVAAGESLDGYVGFAVDAIEPGQIWNYNGQNFWAFAASDDVVQALRKADVTSLDIREMT